METFETYLNETDVFDEYGDRQEALAELSEGEELQLAELNGKTVVVSANGYILGSLREDTLKKLAIAEGKSLRLFALRLVNDCCRYNALVRFVIED